MVTLAIVGGMTAPVVRAIRALVVRLMTVLVAPAIRALVGLAGIAQQYVGR